MDTRYETVAAGDGGQFEAFCAVPDRGSGPGILVYQEIFGINDNMRDLATRLAEAGYVALVPDMFWRLEPRFERKDESGIGDAFAIVQRFDPVKGMDDIVATHAHLLGMPECTGTVGAVGFCFGGGLTFMTAANSRVDGAGPDAAVSYYGNTVNDLLGDVDKITCPIMFHYGDNDPFIPTEKVDEVEQAVSGKPNVTFHRYEAGHAFSNNDAPSMYDETAATVAWERTLAFFREHLGD